MIMDDPVCEKTLQHWLILALLLQCSPSRLLSMGACEELKQIKTLLNADAGAIHQQQLIAQLSELNTEKLPVSIRTCLDACLKWQEQSAHAVLPLNSPLYPPLLKEIADPPAVLFVRGDPALLSLPQVAMVGTRKPSASGKKLARSFAEQLTRSGYLICSGLAHGIDAESHWGALQAEGKTVAVLGTGLEHIYPRQHEALAARICESGALVSEFTPGIGPQAWHFPLRNRIISGLSHGVLVVEAALASGSLITARHAAQQGRMVFAIPGAIQNLMSRGCHSLIRQGAVLVENLQDILDEMPALLLWERLRCADEQKQDKGEVSSAGSHQDFSGIESSILSQIAYNQVSADSIAAALNMDVAELHPRLLEMEMAGLLECCAGNYIKLVTAVPLRNK